MSVMQHNERYVHFTSRFFVKIKCICVSRVITQESHYKVIPCQSFPMLFNHRVNLFFHVSAFSLQYARKPVTRASMSLSLFVFQSSLCSRSPINHLALFEKIIQNKTILFWITRIPQAKPVNPKQLHHCSLFLFRKKSR